MPQMTARQRVLEYIRRRNSATATQIGQALNMAAAAVRHHLAILAADGRIVEERRQGKGKPGRPEKFYRLSDQAAGDNLAVLSDLALTHWLAAMEESARDAAIRIMADGLTERIGATENNLPATRRMVQLVEKLSELHYRARWEAGAEGPRILFGHCPYAAIIDQHPELCAMDAVTLSKVMGSSVEQLAKINRKTGEVSQCVFAVSRGPARRD